MDNLPIEPMLVVLALLVLWSGLFTAIEAAQQHLLTLRTASRSGDKPLARLSFPRDSLILCNTLCRVLAVIISTLLALLQWAENGPWLACLIATSVLLVLADYLPRTLATRYPDAILSLGNTLLGVPLKIIYPRPGCSTASASCCCAPSAARPAPSSRAKTSKPPTRTTPRNMPTAARTRCRASMPWTTSPSMTSWCRAAKSTGST